ncbi:unnamed protein product, partial [Mesorhabditis belari]|uniref:Protein quiver n=1 Tax=Mesorhabditis belari TaxID=2138241 RepID=A0AAF3F2R7_9BILA
MERVRCLIPLLVALCSFRGASSIGCFVCQSFSASDSSCEDPYNSSISMLPVSPTEASTSAHHYQHPCFAFRKERDGLFPADHCIKINGKRMDDPTQTMMIRTCAVDSGSLTADTEIVRISHCGSFKYEGSYYDGCVQSCDTDGCNSAKTQSDFSIFLPILFLAFVFS